MSDPSSSAIDTTLALDNKNGGKMPAKPRRPRSKSRGGDDDDMLSKEVAIMRGRLGEIDEGVDYLVEI